MDLSGVDRTLRRIEMIKEYTNELNIALTELDVLFRLKFYDEVLSREFLLKATKIQTEKIEELLEEINRRTKNLINGGYEDER